MATEAVKVPDLGDVDKVDVVEVLVADGDEVEVDAPLITLESDKASMDVPSPLAGRVVEVRVKAGDKVGEGDLILMLEPSAAAPAKQAEPETEAETAPPAAAAPEPSPGPAAASPPSEPPSEPAPAAPASPHSRRCRRAGVRPGDAGQGLRQPGGAALRPRAGRRPDPGPGAPGARGGSSRTTSRAGSRRPWPSRRRAAASCPRCR